MNTLTLTNKFKTGVTVVTNDFIDHHMIHANGEFVKVYLFLLRHLDDSCALLTISNIADCLNNTENDILRAFRYWESEGLLNLTRDHAGNICSLELISDSGSEPAKVLPEAVSVAVPEKPDIVQPAMSSSLQADKAAAKALKRKQQKELKSLLFIAEQYLAKTLTKTDIDTITYLLDALGMSADLIEYLIESCVENGHKSIHYIKTVALSWHEQGITTVEQAKRQSAGYNKNCYTVLNAFGIRGRAPAAAELSFIRKWFDEMGFSLELVKEACDRTMAAIHQPSFEYTDTILQSWKVKGVHHLTDLEALDSAYQKERTSTAVKRTAVKPKAATKNMNNFERRSNDIFIGRETVKQ